MRDAREGELIEIHGSVQASPQTMRAPVSGVVCAKWDLYVEEQERQHDNRYWKLLLHAESGCDFFVDDDSGRARILGAKVELRGRGQWQHLLTETLRDFLAARGYATTDGMRWRESLLRNGDRVTVTGIARWERDESGSGTGYRNLGRRLVIDAPDVGWIKVH
ncbi:MAG TPA: hypothetical protein VFB62_04210 [Polyangiaceae bacterium]|nr:hypothetical protein [Polyangiaceae bacterium]